MSSPIVINTDKSVHTEGDGHCTACTEDWPKTHDCGGVNHGEIRYDMEAGFTWTYLYTRCDKCNALTCEEQRPAAA